MTAQQIFAHTEKVAIKKIGKESMAVLPLKIWREIEEYIEDIEMSRSKTLAREIKKARTTQKTYSLEEIKKELNRS